jgi:hypothetical protein
MGPNYGADGWLRLQAVLGGRAAGWPVVHTKARKLNSSI